MNTRFHVSLFTVALLIPIIHALATITVNYFPPGGLNPGTVRAGILLIFLMFFCATRYEWNPPNAIILIFLLYCLLLVLTRSSYVAYALENYSRVVLWALMFPVGYYFVRNVGGLKKLNIVYLIVLGIFLFDLILANIFGYGKSDYAEDTVYYGSAGVNITKTMTLILLLGPLFIRLVESRMIYCLMAVVFSLSAVFVLLGLKRSALASVVVGFGLYLILSPERGRALRLAGGIALVVLLLSPLYVMQLSERLEAREEAFEQVTEGSITEEGRFQADILPAWELWWNGSQAHRLFGSEIFYPAAVARGRNMHVDYARYLVGTGLVGLILFLSLHLVIAFEIYRYFLVVWDNVIAREMLAVFAATMVALLIMGYAGTWGIILRAMLFMYWGAIAGVMRNMALERLYGGESGEEYEIAMYDDDSVRSGSRSKVKLAT